MPRRQRLAELVDVETFPPARLVERDRLGLAIARREDEGGEPELPCRVFQFDHQCPPYPTAAPIRIDPQATDLTNPFGDRADAGAAYRVVLLDPGHEEGPCRRVEHRCGEPELPVVEPAVASHEFRLGVTDHRAWSV
jgi:hypothetical protein